MTFQVGYIWLVSYSSQFDRILHPSSLSSSSHPPVSGTDASDTNSPLQSEMATTPVGRPRLGSTHRRCSPEFDLCADRGALKRYSPANFGRRLFGARRSEPVVYLVTLVHGRCSRLRRIVFTDAIRRQHRPRSQIGLLLGFLSVGRNLSHTPRPARPTFPLRHAAPHHAAPRHAAPRLCLSSSSAP